MKRASAHRLLGPTYRAPAIALMAAVAMASYNNLSVTAALPDIGNDLGRVALLPWVVTVELLSAAIAVLAVGPYIDGAGARRAFRLTVVWFTVASAMCTVAPTMELLVAARVLQGLAAGALIGTALTCIGLVFDDEARPWAYALMSSVWGIMGIGGPAVAAALVSTLGWRAVFAVNLPVAMMAAAVGWRRLPTEARAAAESLDRRGLAILSALTVALLLATSDLHGRAPCWWREACCWPSCTSAMPAAARVRSCGWRTSPRDDGVTSTSSPSWRCRAARARPSTCRCT